MGWAHCGQDDRGREIGYAIQATCDHPKCNAKIDRGLAYVCGDMHGGGEHGCGQYFCGKHLHFVYVTADEAEYASLCEECARAFETPTAPTPAPPASPRLDI